MKKLRCGIIGLGRVGKMHIENMLKIPELDIIAVSDFFVDSIGGALLNKSDFDKSASRH
ncbi:hypothetical protein [Gibbsiella quercinecans]|uniref:hypothetical protein n=1 Tax=Gibbsiella quercinecans TaxID=929813 RepID=UPI0016037D9E|nr:hypothetical protein [Gibbsiella quercinecans]